MIDSQDPLTKKSFANCCNCATGTSPTTWLTRSFDLERFLWTVPELIGELEKTYGKPLNKSFWASSLAYQRLKRARQEVKVQEAVQEEKRQAFLQAVEEGQKAWQKWLNDWLQTQRKRQFKVLDGGKKDSSAG
jgi:hypothetical protein